MEFEDDLLKLSVCYGDLMLKNYQNNLVQFMRNFKPIKRSNKIQRVLFYTNRQTFLFLQNINEVSTIRDTTTTEKSVKM